jgi:hypothetical protein
MRTRTILAVAVLAGLTFAPRCATRSGHPYAALEMEPVAKIEPAPPAPVLPVAAPADPFRETIRPILSARCGQCHDPGGRMYARLPFDDALVVSSHGAAILRRLKGDDRAAMEKWLADLAAASEPR